MKPTLLVLAAGMGSRYGSLKQIDGLGPSNETIIDYSVYDAIRAGFGKVVFIIRRDIENDFKEVFGKKFSDKINVEYVFQELDNLPTGFSLPEGRQKPWGTAHAVMMAKNVIKEPFAVINADDFYGADAFKTMADYLSSLSSDNQNNYSMIGYQLKNTLSEFGSVSRGVCTTDSNEFLTTVTERTQIEKKDNTIVYIENETAHPLTGNEAVSMNFWGFTPSYFKYAEEMFIDFLRSNEGNLKSEFYIPLVINNLILTDEIKLKVLKCDAPWFGVTYQQDRPFVVEKIAQLVNQDIYPNNLWK